MKSVEKTNLKQKLYILVFALNENVICFNFQDDGNDINFYLNTRVYITMLQFFSDKTNFEQCRRLSLCVFVFA